MEEKEIKADKLDAKVLNSKKKNKKMKVFWNNMPFFKLVAIILFTFILYIFIAILFMTMGVISMHQNLWGGNLLNNFNSMTWGIIFVVIGIIMILPILKFINFIYKFLKINYQLKKTNKIIEG